MAHWMQPSIHDVERMFAYATKNEGFVCLTIRAYGSDDETAVGIDFFMPPHLSGYAQQIAEAIKNIPHPAEEIDVAPMQVRQLDEVEVPF